MSATRRSNLLTCPHRNTEGLFRLPMAFAAYELQWPVSTVEEAFAGLERRGFIALDRDVDLVCAREGPEVEHAEGPETDPRRDQLLGRGARFAALWPLSVGRENRLPRVGGPNRGVSGVEIDH